MSVHDLLDILTNAGVTLTVAGDTLRYAAPAGALTPALRERIAAHKGELIALLARPKPAIETMEVIPIGACPLWVYDRLYPPGPGEPPAIPPPADLSKAEIAEALIAARKQYQLAVRRYRSHPPRVSARPESDGPINKDSEEARPW